MNITFYEIVGEKSYRQLTTEDKDLIQKRQTELVTLWQDESIRLRKETLFDELFDSLRGLIKGMAYRQAERSFTVEQEDFEGLMNLVLIESMVTFDRTLGKPFQPVFIMNVKNSIKMMYRQKGYDLHDTAGRIVEITDFMNQGTDSAEVVHGSKQLPSKKEHIENVETDIFLEELLSGCFGCNEKKKTVIYMSIRDFKRSEIVSAINTDNKSTSSVERYVNRTLNKFKEHYSEVTDIALT